MNLRDTIRDIPDFPQEGILFKDITTLLKNPAAFRQALDEMTNIVRGQKIDIVVGMESRGFIFGAPLADRLGAGFVPARKLGKLPAPTFQAEYDLEYGTNTIEIHKDAIKSGMKVLIVDDLLATGGTAEATARLVETVGGQIAGLIFLIELKSLKGRSRLTNYPVTALIEY